MMPTMIENVTRVIGAPQNWQEGEHGRCLGLPVRLEMRDGIAFMVSAWRPSPDELAALIDGATVHLAISAPQHPVVQMGVGPVPGSDEVAETTYAKAGVTPGWDRLRVWDKAAQRYVNRSVVEVDTIGGWLVAYKVDAMGNPLTDPDYGNPLFERILGQFELRWRA